MFSNLMMKMVCNVFVVALALSIGIILTTAPSVSLALGATSGNASGNVTKKSSNMTQSASMANKTGAGNKT
ncbi:MAG: hypothetical protein ACHQ1D_06015 [Nitrososphaerales archaeon]